MRKALGNVQVISRIESYLEDLNLEQHSKRLGVFSASDIGTKGGHSLCGKYPMGCARMLYYRYCGEEPHSRIDPRLRRIFDTGSKIHEQLQGYLHKIALASDGAEVFVDEAGFNEENSRVAAEYEIESTTDGIYEVTVSKPLDLRFGIEIKSMKAEIFQDLSGPLIDNVVQSTIYMACLDLPVMVILYYNKNDSSMAEFVEVFDDEIWNAVVDKINYVRMHAVNGEPPPREDGYHCKTCRYAHICNPPKEKKRVQIKKRFRLGGA